MKILSRIKRRRSMKANKTRRQLLLRHLLFVLSIILLVNPLSISASSLNASGSTIDPYKILGVNKSSSQDDIKKVSITGSILSFFFTYHIYVLSCLLFSSSTIHRNIEVYV